MAGPWVKCLFWIYLLFVTLAMATTTNPADPDLWHRLATGEFLWRTEHFPTGDTFSYLADYRQIADHEWGSALVFFFVYEVAGLNAFVGLKLVALAVTLVLVVNAGLRDRPPTAPLTAFYVVVLWAMLPSFQSTVRCMVFTNVLFALWLYWFQRERQGRTISSFLYAGTMIVWANLHGGFVIGLLWLLIVAVLEGIEGRDWRKWAIRFVICTLATLINPFGVQLWASTLRALFVARAGFDEWAPVSWTSAPAAYFGYKLLVAGTLMAFAIQVYRKGWRSMDRTCLVILGLFMALSFTSARQTSLFAIVAGTLIPELLRLDSAASPQVSTRRRLTITAMRAALLLVPLLVAVRLLSLGAGLRLQYPPVACPAEGVAYLQQENVRGNLLVPFNYGSYALWELRGKMRVSMDGRYDLVYRTKTYRRVEDFFDAKGDWPSLLASPSPQAILLPKADPVYSKLRKESAWKESWQNGQDAIFVPFR
jgi:hypothetical protein